MREWQYSHDAITDTVGSHHPRERLVMIMPVQITNDLTDTVLMAVRLSRFPLFRNPYVFGKATSISLLPYRAIVKSQIPVRMAGTATKMGKRY